MAKNKLLDRKHFGMRDLGDADFSAALLARSSLSDDGSLVLGSFWVGERATTLEIQVGKSRAAVDGRDPRDSSLRSE